MTGARKRKQRTGEMQEKRRLPIGIQTFREVRERDHYYVDKTAYARRLVKGGKHYFLSRPRRFGKSLLVDTLKELFEGNEPLFEGLDIHDDWDWSVRRPVLRLDFSSGNYTEPGQLHRDAMAQLEDLADDAGVEIRHDTAPARFRHLIRTLHRRSGVRVAILVDEYDKPILDALDKPRIARANRDALRGLYGIIKDADAVIEFSFITGVSKFSKASLFSGLNNLRDITLSPRYSSICGYTEADLDEVFAPELPGLDREEIRRWYNGYCWLGEEKVYNPFDLLLLFAERRFKAWWFETRTPTFLLDALAARGVGSLALDGLSGSDELLSTFDVGRIAVEALLFQTGYLTIEAEEDLGGEPSYRLGYPNREVRQSLNRSLLNHLADDPSHGTRFSARLYRLLRDNDFAGLETMLRAFFAGIPYQWRTRNDIADYEGYYASTCHWDVGDVGRPHLVRAGERQPAEQVGIDPVSGSGRAGSPWGLVGCTGNEYSVLWEYAEKPHHPGPARTARTGAARSFPNDPAGGRAARPGCPPPRIGCDLDHHPGASRVHAGVDQQVEQAVP